MFRLREDAMILWMAAACSDVKARLVPVQRRKTATLASTASASKVARGIGGERRALSSIQTRRAG